MGVLATGTADYPLSATENLVVVSERAARKPGMLM
jgi:hypothetical protein